MCWRMSRICTSTSPSRWITSPRHFAKTSNSIASPPTEGRSTSLRHLEQVRGRRRVARSKAWRSTSESPMDTTLARRLAASPSLKHPTCHSKAMAFHCAGDQTPRGSYVERADTTCTPDRAESAEGMKRRQLSCTQPSMLFVTMTTVPYRSTSSSNAAALPATSCSNSVCSSLAIAASRRPCCSNHAVGSNVSSQSTRISVSSLA
mmetsp:Transcript_47976/g.145949  ORF Transcript_47976/g.145949 Transcript_47976/m.145949 type:complete len:205 (+) Transcript_47976:134-748(+)